MIRLSPLGGLVVPDATLPDHLLEHAAGRADGVAFVDGPSGRSVSFGQVLYGTAMAAQGLRELGVDRGTVVALYLPNIPEYAAIFLTVARAGGVAALLSPQLSGAELAGRCRAVGATHVVTVGPLVAQAREAGLPIIGVGDAPDTIPFLSLLRAPGPLPEVTPDDLVAIAWSSGTEGAPKPACFTHRNLVAGTAQLERLGYIQAGDVVSGLLPYTHVYGALVGLCLPLRVGARVATSWRFELHELLTTFVAHRVNVAHLVPPLVYAFAHHPAVGEHDLTALRGIVSGASALDPAVARACAARLGCWVVEGYGLTEALATHVVLDYEGGRHLGTVGVALPGVAWRLAPEEGGPAGDPRRGEVLVRSPTTFRGYLGAPDATAAMVDGDGWLHTGDIGEVDDAGRLRIVDRSKDILKVDGAQVAPSRIEAVLRGHPAVADAAVLGQPDPLHGEVPCAFVVLRAPAAPSLDVLADVAPHLGPAERPRRIVVVDAIPRSPAGKLLRRELRAHLRR